MRDIKKWRYRLTGELRKQWQENAGLDPSTVCDIELALTLHYHLLPGTSVENLWVLLTGYHFAIFDNFHWTAEQYQMRGTGRHLLPYYRSPFPWKRAVRKYCELDDHLRVFDIDDQGHLTVKQVAIASDRFDFYTKTLLATPEYKSFSLTWGGSGTFEYVDNQRSRTVTIPDALVKEISTNKHKLALRTKNDAISLSWNDLIETARWMDQTLCTQGLTDQANWEKRLSRVRLEMFNQSDKLTDADEITIQGMMNLIGMVSSGKTTLMTVLAVWGALNGKHITLVVGDVISALEQAQLFDKLGIRAAPVLGSSNRERHMNRLHRVMRTEHPETPLAHVHKGFDWLSSACAISGLTERIKPIGLHERPCLTLEVRHEDETSGDITVEKVACPLLSRCAFHQAQRDLVDSQIWIATPASLVYTGVAPQINREQIRFAELMYRRSDLVIVDEADRVQVQLDTIFSPNQILASKGHSAWFNRLSQQVLPRLNQEGRAQLIEKDVEAWCSAHEMAQMAINRVYAMLLQEKSLRGEVEHDYFTAWMILEQLATRLSGAEVDHRHDDPLYRNFMAVFETLIADPMGENRETELSRLAERSVTHSDKSRNRERIEAWIRQQDIANNLSDSEITLASLLLEFALVVAILSNRLDYLLRDWKQAELALQLEGASSIIFHRPPDDYSPVIPASPMGNVLAFQYLRSSANEPGELRFFRCMGVGRWLLLNLHQLYDGDGVAGPHVILFSGTSWAGKSPSYHIQLPVSGILHAPSEEVNAITQESIFEFRPIYDDNGRPISVSGKQGSHRLNAIFAMLNYFARKSGIRRDKPSLFESERAALPEDRQRILILVGSYDEARFVREHLEKIRPDWRGHVANLVPDDDEFESTWEGSDNTLQRGLVHQFGASDNWILIAPLLAVERGHNILNEHSQAAIGAAYFLIRPHPRPDDISFAIQSINQWAVDEFESERWQHNLSIPNEDAVLAIGEQFRQAAFNEWRYLLRLPLIYSTLPRKHRDAVIWSQMVTTWQVIGRLIRGGSPARIYFCDAAFAHNTAAKSEVNVDEAATSLLVGIIEVLSPYFDDTSSVPDRDRILVQTLYGPFYEALVKMKGLPENV